MTDTPQALLAHHLKALKLPTFLREYDKLARQCATDAVDHVRYLLRLAELELIERERRMVERRVKEARFPAVKSLDSFDFLALPSLNKTLVLELARSEYVLRRENVIAVGNSGTGKSHVALGLGLAACQKGLSVGFTTAAAVVHELIEARDEKRLLRLQRQLAGYKLLVIDELGYVPLSQTGAELLFEVFSIRSTKGEDESPRPRICSCHSGPPCAGRTGCTGGSAQAAPGRGVRGRRGSGRVTSADCRAEHGACGWPLIAA
jgi:DNA replication protein DnaC